MKSLSPIQALNQTRSKTHKVYMVQIVMTKLLIEMVGNKKKIRVIVSTSMASKKLMDKKGMINTLKIKIPS